MSETMIVKKGDSSDINKVTHTVNRVKVTNYSDYALRMVVLKNSDKSTTGIDRMIPPTNDGFDVGLVPDETDQLGVGEYLIVANISKTVGGVKVFNRETSWRIDVVDNLLG